MDPDLRFLVDRVHVAPAGHALDFVPADLGGMRRDWRILSGTWRLGAAEVLEVADVLRHLAGGVEPILDHSGELG